ncbi:MAG: hypothetical protein Q4D38_00150 [Planctomycetia bacterium]|nr:hypothetical protein [Planctomycetia bacterium]
MSSSFTLQLGASADAYGLPDKLSFGESKSGSAFKWIEEQRKVLDNDLSYYSKGYFEAKVALCDLVIKKATFAFQQYQAQHSSDADTTKTVVFNAWLAEMNSLKNEFNRASFNDSVQEDDGTSELIGRGFYNADTRELFVNEPGNVQYGTLQGDQYVLRRLSGRKANDPESVAAFDLANRNIASAYDSFSTYGVSSLNDAVKADIASAAGGLRGYQKVPDRYSDEEIAATLSNAVTEAATVRHLEDTSDTKSSEYVEARQRLDGLSATLASHRLGISTDTFKKLKPESKHQIVTQFARDVLRVEDYNSRQTKFTDNQDLLDSVLSFFTVKPRLLYSPVYNQTTLYDLGRYDKSTEAYGALSEIADSSASELLSKTFRRFGLDIEPDLIAPMLRPIRKVFASGKWRQQMAGSEVDPALLDMIEREVSAALYGTDGNLSQIYDVLTSFVVNKDDFDSMYKVTMAMPELSQGISYRDIARTLRHQAFSQGRDFVASAGRRSMSALRQYQTDDRMDEIKQYIVDSLDSDRLDTAVDLRSGEFLVLQDSIRGIREQDKNISYTDMATRLSTVAGKRISEKQAKEFERLASIQYVTGRLSESPALTLEDIQKESPFRITEDILNDSRALFSNRKQALVMLDWLARAGDDKTAEELKEFVKTNMQTPDSQGRMETFDENVYTAILDRLAQGVGAVETGRQIYSAANKYVTLENMAKSVGGYRELVQASGGSVSAMDAWITAVFGNQQYRYQDADIMLAAAMPLQTAFETRTSMTDMIRMFGATSNFMQKNGTDSVFTPLANTLASSLYQARYAQMQESGMPIDKARLAAETAEVSASVAGGVAVRNLVLLDKGRFAEGSAMAGIQERYRAGRLTDDDKALLSDYSLFNEQYRRSGGQEEYMTQASVEGFVRDMSAAEASRLGVTAASVDSARYLDDYNDIMRRSIDSERSQWNRITEAYAGITGLGNYTAEQFISDRDKIARRLGSTRRATELLTNTGSPLSEEEAKLIGDSALVGRLQAISKAKDFAGQDVRDEITSLQANINNQYRSYVDMSNEAYDRAVALEDTSRIETDNRIRADIISRLKNSKADQAILSRFAEEGFQAALKAGMGDNLPTSNELIKQLDNADEAFVQSMTLSDFDDFWADDKSESLRRSLLDAAVNTGIVSPTSNFEELKSVIRRRPEKASLLKIEYERSQSSRTLATDFVQALSGDDGAHVVTPISDTTGAAGTTTTVEPLTPSVEPPTASTVGEIPVSKAGSTEPLGPKGVKTDPVYVYVLNGETVTATA